jgi:hypothetical protein
MVDVSILTLVKLAAPAPFVESLHRVDKGHELIKPPLIESVMHSRFDEGVVPYERV